MVLYINIKVEFVDKVDLVNPFRISGYSLLLVIYAIFRQQRQNAILQRPTIMYLNWRNTKTEQVEFDYEKDEWLPFKILPTLRHTFLLSKADNNNIGTYVKQCEQ